MWHKAAHRLATTNLVISDVHDYADSGKPLTTEDHAPYSKRAMAQDIPYAEEEMDKIWLKHTDPLPKTNVGKVLRRLLPEEQKEKEPA